MKPFRILLALLMACLAWFLPDASAEVRAGLAIFALAGTLWLTEALPLTFTALLVPVAGILFSVDSTSALLSNFAHPIIFLFLGGFALAAALGKHGIDHWLANRLLYLAGGRALPAALLLSLATALLSMWMSNTATTAMMLPLALGLMAPLGNGYPRFRLFLLLGLAWGANIGGIATLVGSPPNAIAAAHLGWGFNDWLRIGMPLFLLLFPLALLLLWFATRPEAQLPSLGTGSNPAFPDSTAARITMLVFALTVGLWVFGGLISPHLGVEEDWDAWVALLAIVLLGISGTLGWEDIERKVNWGVLLLFGGGITLGSVMQSSGASNFLADGLSAALPGEQPWLIYLLIGAFAVFLSELVSNTANAALLIPLLTAVATSFGISADAVAVLIALCASCAFMLPVATPPNALVFGTGYVPQQQMIRCGIRMDLLCALLIGLIVPMMM